MATFFYRLGKGTRRSLLRNILLLIPGIGADLILHFGLVHKANLVALFDKLTWAYTSIVVILIFNTLLNALMDIYGRSEKSRNHPLKALFQGLQVALFFIGGIVVVAILIGKSPKVLLTGLGASAAVLMLIFKDSILGFVAGVQLSQNNMLRIGDWIQMPDGSANGIVEEITLNTVKVRNWDNTITMMPPYTLVSSPFKNWRGMAESGGRRVDKRIWIDVTTVVVCDDDVLRQIKQNVPMLADLRAYVPLTKDYVAQGGEVTNSQLYRAYIRLYLHSHPIVAQNLDIIVAQREQTEYGLPIEVYFFLTDKEWARFETIQSDIFDHLISMAPLFNLHLYQAEG
ncbi:MAG: mechanosensitive ion channel [Bacteroidales bacterium]|nr:mechanosensitive ion channel [Bacteroidales bacterium]